MNTYLTNNDWKGCNYVKVQAYRQLPDGTWTKKARWHWYKVEKVIDFHKKKKGILTFCTIGHFEQKDKMSKQISNLCGDFDCHDDYEFMLARNSCEAIINYFCDFGLEEPHLRFWFTGGRGYHFEIPHQVFDIEPTVELNLIMKHLASYVNAYLIDKHDDCLEIDLKIYKNPNQYRLPNSYRPDKQTYKIELSWDEVGSLGVTELENLAANPRPPLHDLDNIVFAPIPDAVDWYQDRLKEYQAMQAQAQVAASTTPISPNKIKTLASNPTPVATQFQQVTNIPAGVPVCIADLRQHGIKNVGDRNKATMLDACFCRDAGIALIDAKTIINQWVQAIPVNMTGKQPGQERQAATYATVDYIYGNTKYKFGCSYAIGLGFTCNGDKCPLWQQKAFQKWSKNVQVIPNFTPKPRPTQSHTVEEVRERCKEKVKGYILSDATFALFLWLLQGGGKTTTALITGREIENIRILYAAPRHEIISALETEGLIDRHIYPRDQKHCENSQLAAFYANKRYNVIKKLCARNCEVGMDKCDYFKQFMPIFPGEIVGIVHEDLFIPTYMDKLLETTPDDEDIPTVVIFDEPDPQKFFETVNITNSNITETINICENPETKALLACIRSAIEELKQKERYIGKEAMERILARIPQETTFEKLLKEAMDYANIPDRCRAVRFDHLVFYSEKSNSWLIQIDGKQRWIPEDACHIVDYDGIAMMEKWVIEKHELTPMPDNETLPLNFLSDLVRELSTEYEKYKAGCEYNSIITIGRLPGLKHPIIRLNLPKSFSVPNDTKLVLLDGSGIPELLSVLTGREIETWEAPLQPDVEVVQTTDGSYGITTLRHENEKKQKTYEKLTQLAKQIASEAPEDTVIFTWQDIEKVIREKQASGEFPVEVEIDHYGNIEGKNDYEDKQTIILLGTPTPNPKDMIELASAIWRDDTPLDMESIKTGNYRPYQYVDAQGNGYAVEVREYQDERLNMILQTYREQELVQAAHRHRPILYPGKRIVLETNLPLDSLPPSTLTTVKALTVETSVEFGEFMEGIQEIVKIHSGVWFSLIKDEYLQKCNKHKYILHSCKYSLPTGGTLQQWFSLAVSKLGYVNNHLNFPNTGPGRPLKVYHDGNLDVAKIEALHQQVTAP